MSLYQKQFDKHKESMPVLAQIIELDNKILDMQTKLLELEYDIIMPKTVRELTKIHYREYIENWYEAKHLLLIQYHKFLKELNPSTIETILSRNNAKVLTN